MAASGSANGKLSWPTHGFSKTSPTHAISDINMAAQGKAWPLIDGTGRVYGAFVITGIDEGMKEFFADGTPRKITGFDLHFLVAGDVPEDRIARAIELSREKYCSVWHSLHPAIDFKTSFTVNP